MFEVSLAVGSLFGRVILARSVMGVRENKRASSVSGNLGMKGLYTNEDGSTKLRTVFGCVRNVQVSRHHHQTFFFCKRVQT